MHFADLDVCSYHSGPFDAHSWAVPLRAIGWLEEPHEFTVGEQPNGLVARLTNLVEQTRRALLHYRFRGAYECTFCRAAGAQTGGAGWSQEIIIVPGEREVFVTPSGVVHYITAHRYRPPSAFVRAVLACPDVGTTHYIEALCLANGGTAAPVK